MIQKTAIKTYVSFSLHSFLRFSDYRAISEHPHFKGILQNLVKRPFQWRIP